MDSEQIKRLTSFLYEIGNLRKVIRGHQQMLLASDLTDNIATHSFRVAWIGYFLAKNLQADADKVLKMCLMHDIEEVRSGDHNWVHKKYIKTFEDEIRNEQFSNLLNTEELQQLSKEYDERETLEAKITKDADILDEVFLLREYEWQGNKEASNWLYNKDTKNEFEKLLSTELAQQIVKEIEGQNPSDWWKNAWTPNRR